MLKSIPLGLLMVWSAPDALAPIPTAALKGGVAKVEITPGFGLAMYGEPYESFAVRDAFFLGYTNGSFGYFPTIQSTTRGGYGAATLSTQVEVGAGERMVDHALVKVYKMLATERCARGVKIGHMQSCDSTSALCDARHWILGMSIRRITFGVKQLATALESGHFCRQKATRQASAWRSAQAS